jgi:acyl carrier protein
MSDDVLVGVRQRVQRLIFLAAGGKIAEQDLARHDADLRDIGLDSLGYLNLLEGLERTFGVTIDLDQEPDHGFLHTVDGIVRHVAAPRGGAA